MLATTAVKGYSLAHSHWEELEASKNEARARARPRARARARAARAPRAARAFSAL